MPRRSRKKGPNHLTHAKAIPPTPNALFCTLTDMVHPDNSPRRSTDGVPKPGTREIMQFPKPSPEDQYTLFSQSIFRYHHLWASTINELEHGFTNETFEGSFVEGYFWSPMEKRRFFAALDKSGPHNPAAIQRRIGPSKNIYQVQLYINLLQEAAKELPLSEDMPPTADGYYIPYAYEMSPAWIEFEEQQAHYLTSNLDHEAISMDHYHRSRDKIPPPPELADAQQAVEDEVDEAEELFSLAPLYEWAARNPADGLAPPTMTVESQTVLYRLVKEFVAGVMKCVILNHRRLRNQRRNMQTKYDPKYSDVTVDFYKIAVCEPEIAAALRDYCGDDDGSDMDIDMDTNNGLVNLDADSDLDDDGQGLGFIVGYDSDDDSDNKYSDNDSGDDDDDDKDNDSGAEMDTDSDEYNPSSDSDESLSEDSSSGDDFVDQTKVESTEQDLDEELWMEQEDCTYEQELYQLIVL